MPFYNFEHEQSYHSLQTTYDEDIECEINIKNDRINCIPPNWDIAQDFFFCGVLVRCVVREAGHQVWI